MAFLNAQNYKRMTKNKDQKEGRLIHQMACLYLGKSFNFPAHQVVRFLVLMSLDFLIQQTFPGKIQLIRVKYVK